MSEPNRDVLNSLVNRITRRARRVEEIAPLTAADAERIVRGVSGCLVELQILYTEAPNQAFNFLGVYERLKGLSASVAAIRHDLDRIEPMLEEAQKLTIEAIRIVEHTDDDL